MANSTAANSTNIIPMTLEKVNPNVPAYLTKNQSDFMKMFKKANPRHQISPWNAGTVGSGGVAAFRVPVQLSRGGQNQVVNLDGGDAGSGSLMQTAFMTLGYFATDQGYNISYLSTIGTKNKDQALKAALQVSIESALDEMLVYGEIGMFQDSTGILATATSHSGTGAGPITYTMETAAFTVNRIRNGVGALVDIADSGNVIRGTGWTVTNINYTANTVTVAGGTSLTTADTDQLVWPGMAAVGATIAAGSFRNGLYTFNTTNTSGSLLGLAYATAGELACPQVNGGGGFYTPSLVFAAKSQLTQRRDDAALSGLVGVCHTAQRTSWYQAGITIANQYIRPGESARNLDLAGQGSLLKNTFEAGDITHHVSRYANKSRVDWMVPDNFGWVQLQDTQFLQTPEGQRIFIGHSTTTGNPTFGYQFYTVQTDNLYSVDPGASAVIFNMAIPSGQ